MADGRLANAELLTRTLKQIMGTLLLSWQRILRVGLVTAAVAMLATEGVACVLTRSFPPPPPTHLVAVALALVLGYSVAVTVLIYMLLKGGVTFIRHLEGEIDAGAHAVAAFATESMTRRSAARASAGIATVASIASKANIANIANIATSTAARITTRPLSEVPARAAVAAAASAAIGRDVAYDLLPLRGSRPDVRRDPDDAIIRAPALAMQALPVNAARLPQIGWTYDETRPEPALPPVAYPAPWQEVAPADEAMALATTETVERMEPRDDLAAASDGIGATLSGKDVVVDYAADASASGMSDEADGEQHTPDVPGLIPRGHRASQTRPLPAVTRPLPAITRPIPTPNGGHGGLWQRVSHALVGESGMSGTERAERDTATTQPLGERTIAPEDAWLNG